jgi:hypothetical protein
MAAGDLSRRRYFPRQRGPEATGDYSDWDLAHVVSTRPNVTRGRPVFRGERSTPLQPGSTCRLALPAGEGLQHRRLMGPQPDLLTTLGKFHSETLASLSHFAASALSVPRPVRPKRVAPPRLLVLCPGPGGTTHNGPTTAFPLGR